MDSRYGLSEFPKSEPLVPPSSPEIPSSPPSIASDAGVRRKPKRPPTVTPRRLRTFFTPRSILSAGPNSNGVRTNRQALKTLSSPAVNRLGPAFTRTPKPIEREHAINEPSTALTPLRKRKHSFSSTGSPLQSSSSPLKKARFRTPVHDEDVETAVPAKEIKIGKDGQNEGAKSVATGEQPAPVAPIRRSPALRSSGGLYMRSVLGPRANRTTIRSNSGTGWSPVSILLSRNSNSLCSRLEGFNVKFLFSAWGQP